jgi:hypothetical protein
LYNSDDRPAIHRTKVSRVLAGRQIVAKHHHAVAWQVQRYARSAQRPSDTAPARVAEGSHSFDQVVCTGKWVNPLALGREKHDDVCHSELGLITSRATNEQALAIAEGGHHARASHGDDHPASAHPAKQQASGNGAAEPDCQAHATPSTALTSRDVF